MTPWTAETEGHMIVVEPNGDAQAWPVYDQPDLFLQAGQPAPGADHRDLGPLPVQGATTTPSTSAPASYTAARSGP